MSQWGDMPVPADPRGLLRVRLYVDGKLEVERWLQPGPDRQPQIGREGDRVLAALDKGQKWIIEIYDPDFPDKEPLKFGTDASMMGEPGTFTEERWDVAMRHMLGDGELGDLGGLFDGE